MRPLPQRREPFCRYSLHRGTPGWARADLSFSNTLSSLAQTQYSSSANEQLIFSQHLWYWKVKLGFDLIICHQSVSQCESSSGMSSSLWVYPGSPHTQLPDHTTALRKNLYQAATKDTGKILVMPCPALHFSIHHVCLISIFLLPLSILKESVHLLKKYWVILLANLVDTFDKWLWKANGAALKLAPCDRERDMLVNLKHVGCYGRHHWRFYILFGGLVISTETLRVILIS